ncbi:hypothetical protein H4S08_000806 [Coemansia sp. RSA 1365]|nr:hypothetical protein H4S08_000806 [Coemansia sp. RSA 1365]
MRFYFRRLFLLLAVALFVLWIVYISFADPRMQTVRCAVQAWLVKYNMYPCAFQKHPMIFEHGDLHYYVLWETSCVSSTPFLEWWADNTSSTASLHHFVKPSYRKIDDYHHRYTAFVGSVYNSPHIHYKINDYRFLSKQYTIRRRNMSERSRVLVMADNQNESTRFRRLLALAQNYYRDSDGPDFILHVGDAVQSAENLGDWQTQLFSPMEDVGAYQHHVPLVFIPGNHDHDKERIQKNNNYYMDMYHGLNKTNELEKPAVTNGSYHQFHHSMSIGSARVIVLDAECPSEEQSAFLLHELQSDAFQKAHFRIIAIHIPPYIEYWDPNAWNDEGEKYWGEHIRLEYDPLFRKYRVDLVVSGHQHNYQRATVHRSTDPGSADKITYAIVGGAGGDLDLKRVEDWKMYNVTYFGHHFASLDIEDRRLSWTVHSITGSIVDKFLIET